MKRRLVIHAGTHKTASTYIQERLHKNRHLLSEQNYIYRYPSDHVTTFKSLVKDICNERWKKFKDYIDKSSESDKHLLLSAEQFSVPLNDANTLKKIKDIASKKGYDLKIVIFIRSQLDYINSRYTYSLRRFYHHLSFNDFLDTIKEGKLAGDGKQRGLIRKRDHIFDFWSHFGPLLEAKQAGINTIFLPFKQNQQDPFDQFLEAIELPTELNWAHCSNRYLNQSPGIRGVWLSRLLSERLKQEGIDHRMIEGSSKIILKEESWRGWKDQSFWGFNKHLAKSTYKFFEKHNELFAQQAWGSPWPDNFPNDPELIKRKRCTYRPQSIHEEIEMHTIADQLVRRINHQINPKSWYFFTDSLERIASRINPRLAPKTV
ncbi:hypothetical protein [Synechococcus sp. MIT S1220]|uniref:hypothetical protein n=1 Tax=Synechococcus sp. MIT S1220 TaxID=3082549 RepID=UPI0039AEAAD2